MQPMLRLHVVDEGAHVGSPGGWQEAYAIDGFAGRDRAGNPVPPYPALEGCSREAGGGAEPARVGHHTLPDPGPEVGRGVLAGGGDSARREEPSGSGAELRDGAEGHGGEGTRVRRSVCSYRTRCPCGVLRLGLEGREALLVLRCTGVALLRKAVHVRTYARLQRGASSLRWCIHSSVVWFILCRCYAKSLRPCFQQCVV